MLNFLWITITEGIEASLGTYFKWYLSIENNEMCLTRINFIGNVGGGKIDHDTMFKGGNNAYI